MDSTASQFSWKMIGGSEKTNQLGNYSIGGYPGSRSVHSMTKIIDDYWILFGGKNITSLIFKIIYFKMN